MNIKIFGERNCGTNYVQDLIELNFDVHILPGKVPTWWKPKKIEVVRDLYFRLTSHSNLGWKHSKPDPAEIDEFLKRNSLSMVFVVKNPYSTLLSMARKPHNFNIAKNSNIEDFLVAEFKNHHRDRSQKKFVTPTTNLNDKLKAFIETSEKFPDNSFLLRYEDIILQRDEILSTIESRFNLQRTSDKF